MKSCAIRVLAHVVISIFLSYTPVKPRECLCFTVTVLHLSPGPVTPKTLIQSTNGVYVQQQQQQQSGGFCPELNSAAAVVRAAAADGGKKQREGGTEGRDRGRESKRQGRVKICLKEKKSDTEGGHNK